MSSAIRRGFRNAVTSPTSRRMRGARSQQGQSNCGVPKAGIMVGKQRDEAASAERRATATTEAFGEVVASPDPAHSAEAAHLC